MDILGLFRCKQRDTADDDPLYNFIVRKVARVEGELVWKYEGSFDSRSYDFARPDIPFIRDLTDEEADIPRSKPLPYVEGDL